MKADTLSPDYLESQFERERLFHDAVLKEKLLPKRKKLFVAAYRDAYQRSEALSAEKTTFGFQDPELAILIPWLKDKDVVDYACSYGEATRFAARHARTVLGFDILDEVVEKAKQSLTQSNECHNVRFQTIEPGELPCEPESVDLIFASDVIEHLTPGDAWYFLSQVHQALRPGGKFVCITPHPIYGPSDISRHFLPQGAPSQGFHLKEYTYRELFQLLRENRFSPIRTPIFSPRQLAKLPGYSGLMSLFWASPAFRIWAEEQRLIRKNHTLRRLFGLNRAVYLVATKP